MKKIIFTALALALSVNITAGALSEPKWEKVSLDKGPVKKSIEKKMGKIRKTDEVYADLTCCQGINAYIVDRPEKKKIQPDKSEPYSRIFLFNKKNELIAWFENSRTDTFYTFTVDNKQLYLFSLSENPYEAFSEAYYEIFFVSDNKLTSVLKAFAGNYALNAPCLVNLDLKNYAAPGIELAFKDKNREIYSRISVTEIAGSKRTKEFAKKYDKKKVVFRWDGSKYAAKLKGFDGISGELKELEKTEPLH